MVRGAVRAIAVAALLVGRGLGAERSGRGATTAAPRASGGALGRREGIAIPASGGVRAGLTASGDPEVVEGRGHLKGESPSLNVVGVDERGETVGPAPEPRRGAAAFDGEAPPAGEKLTEVQGGGDVVVDDDARTRVDAAAAAPVPRRDATAPDGEAPSAGEDQAQGVNGGDDDDDVGGDGGGDEDDDDAANEPPTSDALKPAPEPVKEPVMGGCAPPCVDDEEGCPKWAARGECKRNPNHMNRYCARSCGQCTLASEASDAWPAALYEAPRRAGLQTPDYPRDLERALR